jgi:hypothetical protein
MCKAYSVNEIKQRPSISNPFIVYVSFEQRTRAMSKSRRKHKLSKSLSADQHFAYAWMTCHARNLEGTQLPSAEREHTDVEEINSHYLQCAEARAAVQKSV